MRDLRKGICDCGDTARCKVCGHAVEFYRRTLGTSARGGRLYGYRLECWCGWSAKVNDTKREAEKVARDHQREATGPEVTP